MFKRLSEQNWYVKSRKCVLLLGKVELLGHVLTKDGISIVDVKVSAFCDWPVLKAMC